MKRHGQIFALALACALAAGAVMPVPTDEALEATRAGVEELTRSDYAALERGRMTHDELAGSLLDYARNAEDAAAVYLLRRAAFRQYLTGGNIAAAEALNDEIWARAQKDIRPNMTEKDIQRVIRAWMNALGDGEAFETIVCAGANAAECHHVPDGTVWRKGEPLLVDMGVKLDGVCSDMTRCLKPSRSPDPEYDRVYDIVLEANRAAIAAVRPGMTTGALDKVARDIIRKAGYAKAFGHSLGHGVGYEIHELPMARPKDGTVLEPGMLVTIEPGIYLEGRLGVRIEDLVLITTTGCEVLSHSRK